MKYRHVLKMSPMVMFDNSEDNITQIMSTGMQFHIEHSSL